MACEVFRPLDECGQGLCSNNGTCICPEGLEPIVEFNFFVGDRISDLDSDNLGSPCLHNENLLQFIYYVSGVCGIVALVVQISLAERIAVLRHVWGNVTTLVLQVIGCAYRSADPEAFFGVDAFFTFVAVNTLSFSTVGMAQAFANYMYALIKGEEWSSSRVEKYIQGYDKISRIGIIFLLIVAQFGWIASFVKQDLALVFGSIISCLVFVRKYKQDLDTVARFKGNLSPSDDLSTQPELEHWVYRFTKKVNIVYVALIPFACVCVVLYFLPAVWPMWLLFMPYLTPLSGIIWGLLNLIYLRARFFAKRRKRNRENGGEGRNKFPKRINQGGEVVRVQTLDDEELSAGEDELI